MYYDRITGKLVIDSVDIFFISAFAASQAAYSLKKYSSEESKLKREKLKMDRLKADLIRKSRKKNDISKPTNYSKKIQRIYRIMLNQRGGQIDDILALMSY